MPEVLIILLVTGLISLALAALIGRLVSSNRFQIEQGRITEDARLQLERMQDTIRNARNVDCNGDGETETYWLHTATAHELALYTNVDSDREPELVRYYLESGTTALKRDVTTLTSMCTPATSPTTQTLAQSVRNRDGVDEALFTYFMSGDPAATPLLIPPTLTDVAFITFRLLIDVNPTQAPAAAEVITSITPRSVSQPSVYVYTATATDLFRLKVDLADLAADRQHIGPFNTGDGLPINDIAINSRGELYAVGGSGVTGSTAVYRVDRTTAASTRIAYWENPTLAEHNPGAIFIDDETLALGGKTLLTYFNVNTLIKTLQPLTPIGGSSSAEVSGDIVERNGKLLFSGTDDLTNEACFEVDRSVHTVQKISPTHSSFSTVLGLACANSICSNVLGFTKTGQIWLLDSHTCAKKVESPWAGVWHGAAHIPPVPVSSPSPTPSSSPTPTVTPSPTS